MRTLGGVGQIVMERDHQRSIWTDAHDDDHDRGELADEAAGLAATEDNTDPDNSWGLRQKHEGNRIRQLAIAGALIAAEIDRLLRVVSRRVADEAAATGDE